ncbi:aromatic-ring-hydroxylating dioxygenase subunit beta [Immundisolibacter sp.]|uniref:aromatic-ring-hydroxylating dioxygenase subunit beta n=1 Tax=Immundisolibacter sp. TaxID=1934948 RepID=UPI00261A7F99|nr:aromatic-ring-hydroxylating dioxygenase subunit beta [Immundisolibacter sp.]MDD3651666.1 aromatic-ring-hydroxylating dioxygenase subunit beta [Immundisolibacter sp.]
MPQTLQEATFAAEQLLRREAWCADHGRWQDWLALYEPDAVYWVPAWQSETELVSDPLTEVSIIYIDSRRELEHRIWRFTSGESAASTPLPRTNHLIQNVLVQERRADGMRVSANWLSHSYRAGEQYLYGGYYDYDLVQRGEELKIRAKKITLINDRVDGYVDLYHL